MGDEVVTTPFGKFLIDPQDLIGSTLKAGTLWDGPGFLQPIAEEYGQLGVRGVTILDIGANLGSFSVWLAAHGAWRVIAVEPIPQTMQRLKANLDLNREVTASVVIPLEVAAYDRSTTVRMGVWDPGNTGGTQVVEDPIGPIRACALDQYQWLWRGGVALVKIDAQGCDGRALRGVAQTLQRYRPAVVFEWDAALAHDHDDTLTETLAWLEQQDYVVESWPAYPHNYLALPVERG